MPEFFAAFTELRDKVAAIDQNVLINTVLKRPEYQKFIIQLNTTGKPTSQLFELNVDSKGVSLAANRSGYADLTLKLAAEGLEGYTRAKRGRDRVDLNATGDYYKSHAVDIPSLSADYFVMLSDAQKDETDLVQEWGPILGLTPESMELLGAFILKEFLPLFIKEL